MSSPGACSNSLFREASLFGSCMPGQPSEDVIRRLFQIIIDEADFDLISVGEIFIDTPLHNAIKSFRSGTIGLVLITEKAFSLDDKSAKLI